MRSKNILHRDIKPENIMIDEKSGIIKLIDFGLGKKQENSRDLSIETCGTRTYESPEIYRISIQNRKNEELPEGLINDLKLFRCTPIKGYSHETDMWSIGITIYFLLTNEKPFQADEGVKKEDLWKNIGEKVIFESIKLPSEIRIDIPDWVDGLVMTLLSRDPKIRLTEEEVIREIKLNHNRVF